MHELDRIGYEMKRQYELLLDLHHAIMPLLREILENMSKEERVTSKLLNKKDAATYLGISTGTLRMLVHTGQLRYLRIGSRVMFKKAELENYIDRNNKPYSTRRESGRRRRPTGPAPTGGPDAPAPVPADE